MSPLFSSLVTLAVGALIVVVGALLASAAASPRHVSPSKSCDHCGASVFDDWRLCPDCGQRIESCTPDAGSANGARI